MYARPIIRTLLLRAALCGALSCSAANAKKGAWSVVRATDPITGRTTCAVSALDRIAGMRFTRIGALYAVVEMTPEGLLVGVSSGGRYRLPVGDIVWRVDDKPYRTLLARDNPTALASPKPATNAALPNAPGSAAADTAYRQTLDAAMKQQAELVASLTATATMTSGETASAMLEELRGGRGLIFRQQAAVPAYGLPSAEMFAVGQDTNKGRQPIAIDSSFQEGLNSCGIGAP